MMKKIIVFMVLLFLFIPFLEANAVEYVNRDLRLSIKAPEGWYMSTPEGKDTGYLFLFHKYPIGSTAVGANPGIAMSTTKPFRGIKEDFNEAERVIRDYIKTFYKEVVILEQPRRINIGAVTAVRFESEMTVIRKERTFRIREIDYIFLRRKNFFRLVAFCEAKEFEKLKKEFQDSIATLSFR